MEWVKKPHITCETDKTWTTAVRGGGRTSLTWYDKGQEHERPEFMKEVVYYFGIGEGDEEIRVSSEPAYLWPLQNTLQGPNGYQREGDKLLGLHLKARVRVRAFGYRAAEQNIYAAIGGWAEGVTWQRESIFAAIVRDTTGSLWATNQVYPGAIVTVSTLMDDGLRQLPQDKHAARHAGEIIAYDSWTPDKAPHRRTKTRQVMTTEFGPLPVPTESEIIVTNIEESAWWEEEEHEFFFSIDLESALDYKPDGQVPEKDGLFMVLWGGSQHHPVAGAQVGAVLQGMVQFTWEEVLTEGQRRRALRDRLLNTQVEHSVFGRQTHQEQIQEEEDANEADVPGEPDAHEEIIEEIQQNRVDRRRRDEEDDVAEERPHSFRKTGNAVDLERLTGMAWNDEMESRQKRRK